MIALLVALLLLLASPAWAVVALNDTPSANVVLTPAATTDLDLTMTVTAGSNLAIVAQVNFGNQTPGTVTVTWDPTGANQSLTQITGAAANAVGGIGRAELWGLVNPTPGASKILRLHAANSTTKVLDAVVWNGVDQTGGATSFAHGTSATGNSAAPSVTITSAAGNKTMDVSTTASGNFSAPSQTQVYIDNTAADISAAGSRETGSSTPVTHSWTLNLGGQWVSVGVDIVAFVAAGGAPQRTLTGVGQ